MGAGVSNDRKNATNDIINYAIEHTNVRINNKIIHSLLETNYKMCDATIDNIKKDALRLIQAKGYTVDKHKMYWIVLSKPSKDSQLTEEEQKQVNEVVDEMMRMPSTLEKEADSKKPSSQKQVQEAIHFRETSIKEEAKAEVEADEVIKSIHSESGKLAYINRNAPQVDLRFIRTKIGEMISEDNAHKRYNMCIYIEEIK